MNRRNVIATLGLGAAGLSCDTKLSQSDGTPEPIEAPEEQQCSLHGLVSTAKMLELPIGTQRGLEHYYMPELFKVGKSGWICLHCASAELSDICSIRLTPKGGKARA